jgi:hypothetical protein
LDSVLLGYIPVENSWKYTLKIHYTLIKEEKEEEIIFEILFPS